MFDSAYGSGTHNLLHICRSVACSDLLVDALQGAARRPGGHRPNQLQGLLIHFVLAKMSGQSAYPRLHARRIGRQTMKERDFMFDAYNNQGWMSVLQKSVYVAVNLRIKTAKVAFRVIAIMHRLRAKRGLGCAGNETGGLGARVFRKSRCLARLISAFEDTRIIQL